MLRRHFQSISLTAGILLATAFAVASPSTVGAATVSLSADCNVAASDSSLTPSAGDVLDISVTNGTNCQVTVSKTLVNSDSDINLTGTGSTTAVSQGSVWSFYPPNVTAITRVQITIGGSATGTVQFTGSGSANVTWTIGSSSTTTTTTTTAPPVSTPGNAGCEVAGKPCKVRPWPWPVAHTDHINVSWEALIPAEAGTGGVTSYRVESSPAGGTCILRLSEVPAGESLPTNCDITGLDPDTDYTFTVYASSAFGEGPGRSTQEPVRLLAAATPAVTVPAITPETPAPTLPATGQQTVLVGAAVLLIALGAFTTLSARRRRDLSQMAQSIRHP